MAGGVVSNCVVWSNGVYVGTGQNLVSMGGGIYMTGGQVVDSTIVSNLAYNYGYGIYMISGLVDRCRVVGNFSDNRGYFGAGIVMWTTGAVVRNTLIMKNTSPRAVGGVYANQGLLENCTVAGNSSPQYAGGVYAINNAVIRNTIMIFNEAPPLCKDYSPGSGTYQYCCAFPAPAGEGNIGLDPQLVNGPAGDYRLLPGSPCLNAGTNQDWMTGDRDFAGQTRLPDARVDMGALEAQAPGALTINAIASTVRAFAPADIEFTAVAAGTNTSGLTYYWDFNGDGTQDLAGSAAVVTNQYASGVYSVILAATNAAGEGAFIVKTNYVKVGPFELFVATNGSALFPYTNWATASTNVQKAIDAGINGSTVRVTDGVYQAVATLMLVDGVTLRSENGPLKSALTQNGGSWVCQLSHSNAVVDGFTVNKRTGSGGVRIVQVGTVRNCRIVGNRQETEAPVTLDGGGLVTDCYIATNSSRYSGSVRMANQSAGFSALGRLENCVIVSNLQNHTSYTTKSYIGGIRADSNSRIRNCLVAYNLSFGPDGGAYLDGATMENCTIVGNIASNSVDATGAGVRLLNKAVVRNTIMWGHTNIVTGSSSNWYRESGTIEYNCATPDIGTNGAGNIAGPPVFMNAAASDYRLAAGSPGVNQGTNVGWMTTATDLAGLPRVGQKRVDMGAYERPSYLTGSFMIVK
jgi:hypothetical protein